MRNQNRIPKYIFTPAICILIVSLLLLGCNSNGVEEKAVTTEKQKEVETSTATSSRIPSEAIVGENIVVKTPIVEGIVSFRSGEPAYKIGLIIKHVGPDGSPTWNAIDSTYTDRQGKYRFYDNGYYPADKAKYYIYHTFKDQEGMLSYGYEPDAEIIIELEKTTSVPVIQLPDSEKELFTNQSAPTIPITKSINIQSDMIPSIHGMVFFLDNTKGHDVGVILRQECDEYNVLAQITTNAEGYYAFYNVPPGVYWINTKSNNSYVVNFPDAIVIVSLDTTSIVEDLTEFRDISILSINEATPSYPRSIIKGESVEFTWSVVENAAYYEVEIWSTYTEETKSNRDYVFTERTSSNSFTWLVDSSASPYSEFRVDVMAYSADNTKIAANYELFTVSQN